ncbi:dTDP-4-dehydrorhamnose 3,5-epimerase family protein [Dietzia sp.]|uniref:dTDP-4-dehydrorhamnose 3,5-epimerase family protein n=1 Tax=Dietzia sp. TaxID=1871616 RepID=UPI002FD8FDDA
MARIETTDLHIPGAWELFPRIFDDDRGIFLEAFSAPELEAAIGIDFHVAQANLSVSSEGALRGLHFADVPVGQAKVVSAVTGTVLDVIVDIRTGSPTFGDHVAVTLDSVRRNSVYVAEGLAHGFLALEPACAVSYLVSSPYTPGAEHGISPFDETIGVDWPAMALDGTVLDYVLSEKDREAPSLAELESAGALPRWEDCRTYLPGGRG